jgi:hypothetical protein
MHAPYSFIIGTFLYYFLAQVMKRLIFIFLLVSIAGCSIPGLGRCDREFVEVTMNGTLTTNSAQSVSLRSQISDSNIPSDFAALRGAVRNADVDQQVEELIWDLSEGFPLGGFAGFSLALPVSQGEIITIDGPAFRGAGGWGVRYQRPVEQARAGLQFGAFTADSVRGTITVIETDPLALRVDLEFINETQTVRLSGDMQFRVFTVTETCD